MAVAPGLSGQFTGAGPEILGCLNFESAHTLLGRMGWAGGRRPDSRLPTFSLARSALKNKPQQTQVATREQAGAHMPDPAGLHK